MVEWRGVNQTTPFGDMQTDTAVNCAANHPEVTMSGLGQGWWTYEMLSFSQGDVTQLTPLAGQMLTGAQTIESAQAVGAVKGPLQAGTSQPLLWGNWSFVGCIAATTIGVSVEP